MIEYRRNLMLMSNHSSMASIQKDDCIPGPNWNIMCLHKYASLFYVWRSSKNRVTTVTPQIFNFTSICKFSPRMRILATIRKKEYEVNSSPFFYSLGSVKERSSSFSSQEHWTENTGLQTSFVHGAAWHDLKQLKYTPLSQHTCKLTFISP